MTLDAIDAAFVEHWRAAPPGPVSTPAMVGPEGVPAIPSAIETSSTTAGRLREDFVDTLLATAADAWDSLADEVIAARARGHRAIALVSCERGAGCTTLVEGLRRVLAGRGRPAVACTPDSIHDSGPTHDKRILIVDGGVWFPPGRIQRHRLIVASSGCDAAILVVRSGHAPPAAWSTALMAIGVEPLGEVISFVPHPSAT